MQAYLNDPKIKESVLEQMESHRKADTLMQGYGYWKDGKGCAVGCLIHSGNHGEYETRFGIPRVLARLEDRIFEGLPIEDAKKWPERFLSAISPGADLSMVWPKFAIFILTDPEFGVIKFAKKDKSKKSIQDVSDLYQRIVNGEKIDANVWLEARSNATDAYADADAAATAAADAATAAAYATAYAATAYAAAATAAAATAYAADATADATAYARSRHYAALANRLIELLREAK